ncbi:hypothetical protein QVD17_15849 [Tagetes erecta]|uniref:Uncharacterized protein n=1 Tax=Tagetes erecta TaxID=13708 RepID=A0AAD8KTX6_TARER|nr:hypothetical protein QVD17_15849 [Tagetes erecta]
MGFHVSRGSKLYPISEQYNQQQQRWVNKIGGETMVAISVYKGKLHRVAPDTPREWLMPTRKISLKDFKTLLHRRSTALSRLQSQSTIPNPNPNPIPIPIPQSNGPLQIDSTVDQLLKSNPPPRADQNCNNGTDANDLFSDQLVPPSDDAIAHVSPENSALQLEDKATSEGDKRKKEVEEKLQILNERKHKLVQVLKQILNAEEELRRRSSVHGIIGRPSVSLQVDVTNDSGSMSRHVTPRPGSEGADVGVADADDVSNHNMHSRNMTRMSSMSPSSDSLPRRGPFNMVPNPSRGIVASSPSRFAPTSNGTNYVASSPSPSPSPSPAGSVGTSVFRDAVVSPWN